MATGKIMVVEDEESVREALKMQLESAHYNVLEAENGEQAIRVLKSESNMIHCGLILCDISMPKVNGLEGIAYFQEQAPGIPIVVVTGFPDTEMAVDLMGKGVKDYWVKPVEKTKLLAVVEKLVSQGKSIEF
ncbi:MAG: response regulator [Proteobacteria bacterium]|nr:response regulator [Pseudomonadota bacterium]